MIVACFKVDQRNRPQFLFEILLAKISILFQNTMQYHLKLSYLSVFLWLFAKV